MHYQPLGRLDIINQENSNLGSILVHRCSQRYQVVSPPPPTNTTVQVTFHEIKGKEKNIISSSMLKIKPLPTREAKTKIIPKYTIDRMGPEPVPATFVERI